MVRPKFQNRNKVANSAGKGIRLLLLTVFIKREDCIDPQICYHINGICSKPRREWEPCVLLRARWSEGGCCMRPIVWKIGLWETETEVPYPVIVKISSPSMVVLYADNQNEATHGGCANGIPKN